MTGSGTPVPLILEWHRVGEEYVAVLDGGQVARGDLATAHAEAILAVQTLAARSPTGFVTIVVRSAGVEQSRLVVSRDGAVLPSGDAMADPAEATLSETVERTRRADRAQGAELRPQATPTPAPTRVPSRDSARGQARASARKGSGSPGGEIGERPTLRRETRRLRRRAGAAVGRKPRRRGVALDVRRWIRLLVPIACVGLVALVGLWALRHGAGTPDPAMIRGEMMAATAPLEWAPESRWRSPALLPEAGRILVMPHGDVAFVVDTRQVVLVDAATGDVRWSAPYPTGTPRTDLTTTTVDGRTVIAAQIDQHLAWWDVENGRAESVDLPDGSSAGLRGDAPVIVADDGTTAGRVHQGRIETVDLPQGAVALAGRADGLITAASGSGWWHLTVGQAPGAPRPWEIPGGATSLSVVSYLGGSIVTMLPAATGTNAPLVVFADRDGDVRFSWLGEGVFEDRSAAWHPSPSERWGILGRTLIDLEQGRTTDLGRWSTQLVSADRALGEIAGQKVLTGPSIPLGAVQGDESFPEDLTEAGALVRAQVSDSEVVYLLPPRH
ncbi:MAG: hypothetical protein ABI746_05070 [Dermatophilaceae bacterium]